MATTPFTKSQGPAKSRRPRSSASASGSGLSVKTCFTPLAGSPSGDAAAGGDLGVDAEVLVAPAGAERAEGVGVADAGGGVDGGGLAAGDALAHAEGGLADADVAADEVELGEGREAVEPDVAAEALHGERHARGGRRGRRGWRG